MTDIFDEVGEDLRRDKMQRLWKRYSGFVYGGAFAIVVGTAAFEGYDAWRTNWANTAGDAYVEVLAAAKTDDHVGLATSLAAYQSSAPAQYALLARFRAASEHAAAGEIDNALAAFEALAADGGVDRQFRDLAAVRAALIAVDREDLDKIKARVAAFANDISPWRFAAREAVAIAAVKAENWAEAASYADKLVADPMTPSDVRSRAQVLSALATSATGKTAEGSGS